MDFHRHHIEFDLTGINLDRSLLIGSQSGTWKDKDSPLMVMFLLNSEVIATKQIINTPIPFSSLLS